MKTRTQITFLATVLTLLLVAGTAHGAAALLSGPSGTAGSIALGVQDFGNLNEGSGLTVNGGSNAGSPGYPASTVGPGSLGLAIYLPAATFAGTPHPAGYYDSTSPGCLCEGWGVSADGTPGAGADIDSGGINNLTLDSFTTPAGHIISAVHMTSGQLSVVQDYKVSGSSASVFEDTVTIKNTTGATLNNVLYRRVMDWDIPYTEFSEAVTIQGWPATNLFRTTDNGFDNPNPAFAPSGSITPCAPVNANFTDCGAISPPNLDHGALFDFNFGSLAAGASKTFKVFYGASLNESLALSALSAVGAEVYSLGQSDNTGGSATLGTPATYFFGFAGVGGTPLVPEPSSMLLFAVPALFAINSLKKKFRKA